MEKELLKLWFEYLDELIDELPVDNLPSGNEDTWRQYVGQGRSLYEFMIWLDKRNNRTNYPQSAFCCKHVLPDCKQSCKVLINEKD